MVSSRPDGIVRRWWIVVGQTMSLCWFVTAVGARDLVDDGETWKSSCLQVPFSFNVQTIMRRSKLSLFQSPDSPYSLMNRRKRIIDTVDSKGSINLIDVNSPKPSRLFVTTPKLSQQGLSTLPELHLTCKCKMAH